MLLPPNGVMSGELLMWSQHLMISPCQDSWTVWNVVWRIVGNCKVAALISIHGDPPPLCRFYITSPTLGPSSLSSKYELISLYERSHWAAFYFQFMLPRFETVMGESCLLKHPRNNQKMLSIGSNQTEFCFSSLKVYNSLAYYRLVSKRLWYLCKFNSL